MTMPLLQIGQHTVTATEIIPLLIRYQLRQQLCRELTIDQAISQLDCDPTALEVARHEFYEQHQMTEDSDRQAWLSRTGMSLIQLEALATRAYRIEQFKQQTWGNKLESHFLTCKAELDQVTYSLLRHPDPGIIQELYFRIQAGEDSFAAMARQYSQGVESETGGLLGPVPLTQPHPALAEKLAKLRSCTIFAKPNWARV